MNSPRLVLGCVFLGLTFVISACGGGGSASGSSNGTSSSSGDDTTDTAASAFPTSFAVTSPLDFAAASASENAALTRPGGVYLTEFSDSTDEINDILNGASTASCAFDPSLFLSQAADAGCYGPEIEFANHPQWTSGSDPRYPTDNGTLPVGDLGLWSETDNATGEACAAAELNARMEGLGDNTEAALQTMASLICTAAAASGGTWTPPANATQDWLAEMNDMAAATGLTVTFTTAAVTHSDSGGNDEYTYDLDFTYTDGGESYGITVSLVHVPGCDENGYQGRLAFAVNDTQDFGNCSGATGGGTANITQAGSVLYRKYSDHAIALDARGATFCGHDADAVTDGLVDPSNKYDASTNPDGWTDHFNRFIANFDSETLAGQYSYSWQAGANDGATRVFNIFLEEDPVTELLSGAAFFGFGDDIDGADGSIDGFICNWAGPGFDHTPEPYVQAQYIEEDSGSGLFTSDAARLAITYAPLDGCDYDGTGSFVYDSDDDGALSDENAATAVNDNLADLSDVEDNGFRLPAAPDNITVAACTDERLYVGTGEYDPSANWDAILRFENVDDWNSEVDGDLTPDGTVPAKDVEDADNLQMNFIHTIYVWEDRDELYAGSLFTNATNSVDASLGEPNIDQGSVGSFSNASTADGARTLDRHLYGATMGGAAEIYQPHGVWVDEDSGSLYSANSFGNTITVHDAINDDSVADPATAPARTISHAQLGAPIHVYYDSGSDRLFVAAVGASSSTACAQGGQESIVAIYENAASADGGVAPDVRLVGCNTRLMTGNTTTHNVWYVADKDMLIVGHHTNEILFFDLSSVDSAVQQDWDLAPARVLELQEDPAGSDSSYWSAYGLFYLADKDRLYVSAGYNDPRPSAACEPDCGAPDSGTPPNEVRVYDGVSLSHFDGLMPPTRTVHWDGGGTYYPPQALWVTEY